MPKRYNSDSDSDTDSDSDSCSSCSSSSSSNCCTKTNKTANIKEYRKQYYQQNKKAILSKLYKKVECEICGRKVNHQQLKRHQKLPICRPKQNETDELKEQIESLRKKICGK